MDEELFYDYWWFINFILIALIILEWHYARSDFSIFVFLC